MGEKREEYEPTLRPRIRYIGSIWTWAWQISD